MIEGAELTVRLSCLEPLPKALVAFSVKVAAPAVVGVPPITPTVVFIDIPLGSAPLVIAQVIGPLPDTARVCTYGVPAWAAGSGEAVRIEGGPFTVRPSTLELLPKALVALTVKPAAPAAVGVPLMVAVDAWKVRPAGKAPPVTAHLTGVLPEAARVCE